MGLHFNRDFAPPIDEPVTVAPGIRRVTAGNAGPFTFRGTNTFLIGEHTLAVLDPGPDDPAHVDALMRAIGEARVAHILVSHTHRDHSPAARLLQQRTGAPTLAAGPHSHARRPHPDERARSEKSGDMDFVPDRTLSHGDVVEGDGYRLEALATPGHTPNHLAFAWPERGLIFSGDHVMGWSTTVVSPPDGSMADYMASLELLAARPERLYLPSHGPEIHDAPDFVRALRTHRKMRSAAILAGLGAGDSTVGELVTRIYSGIAPAVGAAAARSVLAHLEELIARGAVRADGAATLDARYQLAEATPEDAAPGSG